MLSLLNGHVLLFNKTPSIRDHKVSKIFSKKVDKWRMNKPDQEKSDIDNQSKRYRAAIDKNTSVEVIRDKEIS